MLNRDVVKFVGLDYGADKKLRAHGPNGPIEFKRFPPVKGGVSPAYKNERMLKRLLDDEYTVVTEAATVGSSGMEKEKVGDIMLNYPSERLQTIQNHAVKNYRKDNDLKDEGDAQAAEIIYKIAKFGHPQRLHEWVYNAQSVKRYKLLFRKHTSVRPLDQRGYKDEESLRYLSKMPDLIGDAARYLKTPSTVMPFLMAFDEDGAEFRDYYLEKIIGTSERRIPSFYSRARIDLMQDIAKDLVLQDVVQDLDMQELAKSLDVRVEDLIGEVWMIEVPEPTRKKALRKVQTILREFHRRYVAKNFKSKTDPVDSKVDPVDSEMDPADSKVDLADSALALN